MATLALRRGLGWIDKLFTVVHVKEMKLFFDRVTGRYDGLSIEAGDCERPGPGRV